MADVYQSFLKAPSAGLLAPDASLHYITTTTSIHHADAIIKHLQAQEKQVEKRGEVILSCLGSTNGVCLETETTFKFKSGGGLILPQMDDNMLADMEAVCLMVGTYDPSLMSATDSASGPHRPVRCQWQDCTDPLALGPGHDAEAGRSHWQDWSQLAYTFGQ